LILGLLSGEESISREQSVVSDTTETAGTIGEADQISPVSPKNGGFIDPHRR
jgi:hypothetical protein